MGAALVVLIIVIILLLVVIALLVRRRKGKLVTICILVSIILIDNCGSRSIGMARCFIYKDNFLSQRKF